MNKPICQWCGEVHEEIVLADNIRFHRCKAVPPDALYLINTKYLRVVTERGDVLDWLGNPVTSEEPSRA